MRNEIKGKEENEIKKLEKIAETRMAVHTHTHTLYCHLENKNTLLFNITRDRIILFLTSISLSLFVLNFYRIINKIKYKSDRAGP